MGAFGLDAFTFELSNSPCGARSRCIWRPAAVCGAIDRGWGLLRSRRHAREQYRHHTIV
jgi:hypothetical protein